MLLLCPSTQGLFTEGPNLPGTILAMEMQLGAKETDPRFHGAFILMRVQTAHGIKS